MKIAIVGAHRDTKLRAPYDDPEWEIWACSARNESELPRQDVWFELHRPEDMQEFGVYWTWLATLPLVYMQRTFPEIPGSRPYPLEAIVQRFGRVFLQWTPCFMMAMAILQEPEVIGLWGFSDQRVSEGFGAQRLCLQHFIAIARSEGITVECPAYLDEARPLYGYERT